MYRWLVYIFILCSFFPYIQFIPLGTDSQPNAVLVGMLLFLFHPIRMMNYKLRWLLYTFVVACGVVVFGKVDFASLRVLFNYFSLFFLTFMSFNLLKRIKGIPFWTYQTAVIVYFVVGLVQLLINPSFLSFLVPRGDSEATLLSGRGVICLAPEPTFYGLLCLFLLMIGYLNFRIEKRYNLYQALLLVQLLFFSRSSMCIFVIVLAIGAYLGIMLLRHTSWKLVMAMLGAAIVFSYLLPFALNYLEGYRIGILLTYLYTEPSLFITLDASVNERFNHIFFPICGFLENWGIPHGYDGFKEYVDKCMSDPRFSDLFTDYTINSNYTRIMSAISGAFYELGIFALFIVIFVINVFYPLIKRNQTCLFLLILFFGILTNAVPFSNALIPFFLGNLLFLGYEQQNKAIKLKKNDETVSDKCYC